MADKDNDEKPDLRVIFTSPEDFVGGEPEIEYPEFGEYAQPAVLPEDDDRPDPKTNFLKEEDEEQ